MKYVTFFFLFFRDGFCDVQFRTAKALAIINTVVFTQLLSRQMYARFRRNKTQYARNGETESKRRTFVN